jgi:hypothetical protein
VTFDRGLWEEDEEDEILIQGRNADIKYGK